MSGRLLLVHDDLDEAGAVQRALEGFEVVVAHTVADALAVFDRLQPGVVLLAPGVESGRGHVVLEELVHRPNGRSTAVLLLGEQVPGFDHPVAAMPPGPGFAAQVQALVPEVKREVIDLASRALEQARTDAGTARRSADRKAQKLLQQAERAAELAQREVEARTKLAAERDGLARRVAEMEQKLARVTAAQSEARARAEALASERGATAVELEQARAKAADVEAEAAETRQALDAAQARLTGSEASADAAQTRAKVAEAELELLKAKLLESEAAAVAARELSRRVQADLDAARARLAAVADDAESVRKRVAESQTASKSAWEKAEGLRVELEAARAQLSAVEPQAEAIRWQLTQLEARAAAAEERTGSLETELDAATGRLSSVQKALAEAEAAKRDAHHQASAAVASASSAQALARKLESERGAMDAELDAARARLRALEAAAVAQRERAEQAEASLRTSESRTVLRLESEVAVALQVPRSGTAALGELARLMAQLGEGRADVRVDLTVPEGTRKLWLKRGALVAATSPLKSEAISERARRDGLIDARQEAELQDLRETSPVRLVHEMRRRGVLRKAEVAGLVERFTTEVAIEALSEAISTYRLHDEAPGEGVPVVDEPVALMPLVARALRRALPWEAQLELLGGARGVPRRSGSMLDAEALGFSDRERRLLERADGETVVETLVATSELKPERAWQALSVAKLLGVIDVLAPREALPSLDADAVLVAAKYEQVQHADYFAILGLPRTAGADEVQRAQQSLAERFDPLRFAAHPDPAVLHRARAVWESIREAARTLQDDRLRSEYARHLVE